MKFWKPSYNTYSTLGDNKYKFCFFDDLEALWISYPLFKATKEKNVIFHTFRLW